MAADIAAIVDLFAAALTGHTDAGAAVFVPRSWPTAPSDMPMLGITPGPELKTGEGRSGAPAFTTAAVIRVMGRLTAKAEAGDAGAAALLGAMMVLQRQIERAVINEPNLRRVIQQFKSVKVTRQIETKETIVGDLAMDFEVEFYQPAEDFFPIDGDAIETLAVYADLINVFSPSSDFTGQPDATPFVADASPAPRTSGPDGRAEGAVDITLPQ
jgi:hypothetical protein